jgi:hypothetical protein
MKTRIHVSALVCVVSLLAGSVAHATFVTAESGGVIDSQYKLIGTYDVSNSDLLQTNLSSATVTAGGPSFDSTVEALYNGIVCDQTQPFSGTAGENGFAPGGMWASSTYVPTTVEFALDTTAHPLGYDLTSIQSLSGYIQNRNFVQNYELDVMKVGSTSWTMLYSVDGTLANNNHSQYEVRVTASDFGAAGQNIAKLRMVCPNGSTYLDCIQYRELDVFGTPAVPEPSSIAIVATALISLLAYAWRKRK